MDVRQNHRRSGETMELGMHGQLEDFSNRLLWDNKERGAAVIPRTIHIQIDRCFMVPPQWMAKHWGHHGRDPAFTLDLPISKVLFVTASTFDQFSESLVSQILNELRERRRTHLDTNPCYYYIPMRFEYLDMNPTGTPEEFMEVMASWNISVGSVDELFMNLKGEQFHQSDGGYGVQVDFTVLPRPAGNVVETLREVTVEREKLKVERQKQLEQVMQEIEDEEREFEVQLKGLREERREKRKKWEAVLDEERAAMAKDEEISEQS